MPNITIIVTHYHHYPFLVDNKSIKIKQVNEKERTRLH